MAKFFYQTDHDPFIILIKNAIGPLWVRSENKTKLPCSMWMESKVSAIQ